jgi:hypothetical protein
MTRIFDGGSRETERAPLLARPAIGSRADAGLAGAGTMNHEGYEGHEV